MSWQQVGGLLGGIGLFLLGMRLMTDGLTVAAGPALRDVLSRSARTRLRGVASGFVMTAIVQSSSAITVATIGFVNAGLLSLAQALAIIYGSNIGTTMTAWLVAAIGFHVNVRAFALPLVGLGMAARLMGRGRRAGFFGEALAGFGLFFLGIDVLRVAFDGIGDQIALGSLAGEGPLRALLLVGVGFLLTLLMQSSSAAIAIILTATGGGVVPPGAGAALVIGANVGTTSTAALAVVGATPNARRVAAGHVAFNLITGAAALLLLPLLLVGIQRGREALELGAEPAALVAGFHTLFNLLGVALLWPITERLVRFLEGRFRTSEEDEATPRYLDRNVLATPHLAEGALALELARAGQIVRRVAGLALEGGARAPYTVAAGREALNALVQSIGEYTQDLYKTRLPEELETVAPTSLLVSRYYSEAAELSGMIAEGRPAVRLRGEDEAEVDAFVAASRELVDRSGIDLPGFDPDENATRLASLETRYHAVKKTLLAAGSSAAVAVPELVDLLDWLSNIRRLTQQIEKGARSLSDMAPQATAPGLPDRAKAPSPQP